MLVMAGASACGASYGQTAEERAHMYSTVTESELQMIDDDVDNFMMMDRRSRLTKWH
jgi:hypothetical protein